jgi:hypothetical protein
LAEAKNEKNFVSFLIDELELYEPTNCLFYL